MCNISNQTLIIYKVNRSFRCLPKIFLMKEDTPLHIQFLKLVYSEGRLTSGYF